MKTEPTKAPKWYVGGLHFECTGCGGCCSGPEEGYVWLRKIEIGFMAEKLNLSDEEMTRKFCRRISNRYSLIEKKPSNDCIFLENTPTGKGCEVYDCRPNQCRTWPFWSSNLMNPDMWNYAAISCPGVNRGKYYSFEEIEKIRKQEKWWTK